MRPIPLVLCIGLVTSSIAPAAPPIDAVRQPPHCPGEASKHLARPGKPGPFHRLTELPPARAYYPMLERGADGCITPVLYGTRRGAPPARQMKRSPLANRSFP